MGPIVGYFGGSTGLITYLVVPDSAQPKVGLDVEGGSRDDLPLTKNNKAAQSWQVDSSL